MRANNRRLFETGDKRRAVVEEEGGKKLDGGMVDGGEGGRGGRGRARNARCD